MTDDAEPLAADFPTNRKAMTDAELSAEARKAAPLYGNDWGPLLIRMADRLDERARESDQLTKELHVDSQRAEAAEAERDRLRAQIGPPWKCGAQRTADPPQDCDWPSCGCDPWANKVLEAVEPDFERLSAEKAELEAAYSELVESTRALRNEAYAQGEAATIERCALAAKNWTGGEGWSPCSCGTHLEIEAAIRAIKPTATEG